MSANAVYTLSRDPQVTTNRANKQPDGRPDRRPDRNNLQQLIESTVATLQRIEAEYLPASMASSLSAEDMVLLDLIYRNTPRITVFTIDTGRLNSETYALHQLVRERYGAIIATFYPQTGDVEQYTEHYGINGFYASIEARQACCAARKVAPLRRALAGQRAWLTGMRREQAVTREHLPVEEFDEANQLMKFNPLAAWQEEDIWQYIRDNAIPYNALYDKGYRSIGCAPCTRAVAAGEDARAGRWWWEAPEHKECGLHTK
ncbi:phosphoadenylyl-sulfate reductase [Halorhodospira halochloris]|uniref:phosphoadenylyl-sulfate reductase n=1 Tax=Halorhodospira halochloris TaxID=1052 RepID=UPI001EE8416B|nr:phosphoadenylyl-sulfate reductase [Halorhodospira halochloris]MCG5529276.1 phosphoadenylyl-sulfate reductase [Halorhodospira halochloris]